MWASSSRSSMELKPGYRFGGCRNWKSNDYEFFEWMDLNEAKGSSGGVNQREHGNSQRFMNEKKKSEFEMDKIMDQIDAMRREIVEWKDINKEIHI